MNVFRFPTERTRLPGETREKHAARSAVTVPGYIVEESPAYLAWDPPILEDLANGRVD